MKSREKVLIIAEAGVNHNGSLENAKRLIEVAAEAGADIVKFQTGLLDNLVSKSAKMAEYQVANTGKKESQKDMLRKLLLGFDDFIILADYCKKCGITFLSTPFDIDSIRFLEDLNMPFWKIPSGEVTNYPYLCEIGKTGRPVIMSTGMCEMYEIQDAIDVLNEKGAGNISLMHCNTEYPTPYEDVNLCAMQTMRDGFGLEVGYSDHTKGIEVPVAAVALGATIIEKHFTLSRNMEGPDHKASLEPDELAQMVRSIRNTEEAIGSGEKKPTKSEVKNRDVARKSIVAKRSIKEGEVFTEENLCVKRPGNGICPMRWNEVLGKSAKRCFTEDELIEL